MSDENYPDNCVYYRLYVDSKDEPCVVSLQPFDEYDYDQGRFINKREYSTEEEAEQALQVYKIKAALPLTNLERLKVVVLLDAAEESK